MAVALAAIKFAEQQSSLISQLREEELVQARLCCTKFRCSSHIPGTPGIGRSQLKKLSPDVKLQSLTGWASCRFTSPCRIHQHMQVLPPAALDVQVQENIKESCSQKLRQVHEAFQTVLPSPPVPSLQSLQDTWSS